MGWGGKVLVELQAADKNLGSVGWARVDQNGGTFHWSREHTSGKMRQDSEGRG